MIESPALTQLLVREQAFVADPLFVVDVGASGGIDPGWYAFQDQLRAIGFDPLCAEIKRLRASSPRGVTYVAAWVTSHAPNTGENGPETNFFSRTSAVRAAEIVSLDYAREHFSADGDMTLATDRIVLDDYFSGDDASRIDFVKIDTDGHDFEVLRGCDRILSEGRVLGVSVEAQFQGPVHEGSGVFSDVDALLRKTGFSLFDLEVHRYSRAVLPAPFVYDIPAQTTSGQVFWGDAIYLRDLGHPSYETMWHFHPERLDILKLACLFELFGLPDCSAELILKYGIEFGTSNECDEILDLLAAEQSTRPIGYAALLEEFEATVRARFQSA